VIYITSEPLFPAQATGSADLVSADAKQFASLADAVVLAVGFNAASEGEGHDRTFTLPWGQDALVEAIAAANPHTTVTLTGGGGMDVSRWLDKVPVLLHTYYPGQEGGTAVADVLFGKHNPEGKLPVSFDRSWEDNPSYPWYYGVRGGDTFCTRQARTAGRSTTPSSTSSMETSSWLAIAIGRPRASTRSFPLASA
jgi:Glycosyl hydrolase family 3 C-terminal domain